MSEQIQAGTRRVLSPSQLNALARSLLEDSFPLVEVEGELSNLARPASGHLYCTLKDRNAQVRCALFRPKAQWLKFKPADGQKVRVRGRLTLYEPRGDYQLVLEHMEPAGEGDLQRAFEELKQRLQAEGLFDAARKRPLPRWVGRLGVLTSPSGAAIHDVLSVLRRRFPLIAVDVLPVVVQGAECPPSVCAMLQRADASGRYDLLLLTRGGGSLEDLNGFNHESIARTLVTLRTPVIAAIGHEIDASIAEFAADLRCPTPSAAAEALSPDRAALAAQLRLLHGRLQRQLQRQREQALQALDHLQARLQSQRPLLRLQRMRARAVELDVRARHARERRLEQARQRIDALRARLQAQSPRRRIEQRRQQAERLRIVLQGAAAHALQGSARALQHLGRTLHAVSPLATLERGYSILSDDRGTIRSVHQLAPDARVRARLADGTLSLRVLACEPGASAE